MHLRSSRARFLAGSLLAFFAASADAAAECHWNKDRTSYDCDGIGIVNGVGFSLPTTTDILSVNPAAIPTLPTPTGIEGIYSSRSDAPGGNKLGTSLIRGFNGFGLGVGTRELGSFSGPNLKQLFAQTQYRSAYLDVQQQGSSRPGYQLGTAVGIPLIFDVLGRLSVGASAGQTATSSGLAGTIGSTWTVSWFNFGYSYGVDKISNTLPTIGTSTFSAGLRYDELSLTYSRVDSGAGDSVQPSSSQFSVRWKDESWAIFGGIKTYSDDTDSTQLWSTASVYRSIGSHFAIGYIYGLYQDSHSLGLQVYL